MKNIEILKFNLFNYEGRKNEAKDYFKGMIMGALLTDGITMEEFEELKEFIKEECD